MKNWTLVYTIHWLYNLLLKVIKNHLIICRRCPLSSPRRKKHLAAFLVSNSYPFSFLQKLIRDQKNTQQCWTHHWIQIYCGLTLCQRSVQTTSQLSTATRGVGDYAKLLGILGVMLAQKICTYVWSSKTSLK